MGKRYLFICLSSFIKVFIIPLNKYRRFSNIGTRQRILFLDLIETRCFFLSDYIIYEKVTEEFTSVSCFVKGPPYFNIDRSLDGSLVFLERSSK